MEGHRKRKPLSDISNTYNLIPTSALRKLVAASTNSSSCSKPPLSILKSSSVSSNPKLCSESSNRSDISIGSSNVRGAWNSRTVQFHTPPRDISSITRTGGRGGKDAPYNRKQTTEKLTKEREEEEGAVVVASPTFVEKRKDKGKGIAEPFSSLPPDTTNDNQSKFLNPSSLLKRENQKGSAYRNLFSGLVEKAKESKKSTLNSHSRPYGKAEKAKGIADYSSFSLEKTIVGEKSGSSSDGKKRILKQSGPSVVKTKEMGKESVDPNFLVERAKDTRKPLDPVGYSIERTREKGKAIMQVPEVVVTKSKGCSVVVKVNTRPPRRKSVKRKTDAGAYSCPPMTRSKNLRIDLDEAEDMKSSKSWTDAHPKSRKRPRVNVTAELPPEFVEQQNAYYKEIDAFELPEEEISENELE